MLGFGMRVSQDQDEKHGVGEEDKGEESFTMVGRKKNKKMGPNSRMNTRARTKADVGYSRFLQGMKSARWQKEFESKLNIVDGSQWTIWETCSPIKKLRLSLGT